MGLLILGMIGVLGGLVAFKFLHGAEIAENAAVKSMRLGSLAAVVLFAFLIVASFIKTVPTGHTGVVLTFGHVENYTYEAGIHFDLPWRKIVNMDNRTQKAELNLSCFSSDIQETNVSYAVNYSIDKANAQEIYRTIGANYYDQVILPKVQESVKGVFAKYNAESLVSKRAVLSAEIEDVLREAVAPYNVHIVSTSLENIDFTDSFTNAVEAKQVAEQNKLRAKTEQEQAIIEANANAEKVKIEAQAKADAQIISAEADAEVAKIGADAAEYQGIKDAAIMSNLGEMLAKYPNLVDYYRATNWNGELPDTYIGNGSGTLLDITK